MGAATICDMTLDAERLATEAPLAHRMVDELPSEVTADRRWITFPLINATGSSDDYLINPEQTAALPTPHADRFPLTMAALDVIRSRGIRISHARFAVLFERDVLRPHIDEYATTRLIFALNEQGTDFRHVFDSVCLAMRPGQVWRVRGDVCHGAANIALTGRRAAVILDVDPATASAITPRRWTIPKEQIIHRPPLTRSIRQDYDDLAWSVAREHRFEDAERVWLFLPFEVNIRAARVYTELVAFAERNIGRCRTAAERAHWRQRLEYLLHPKLRFEIPAKHHRRALSVHGEVHR